jgi:hypothetical protein
MICAATFLDRVVLVGHDPLVVFATTASHVEHLRKKPNGHYDREDVMSLVETGDAVLYDEQIVRDIISGLPHIVWGCPPLD